MVLKVRPFKKNCTFVFFFKFVTKWWMNLHFHMILYHKKPIAHDVLPNRLMLVAFVFNFSK